MIENTLFSIEKITGQLKTLNTVRKFVTLILYSAYLVYRIVSGGGYLALNIALLAITCLYGAFFIYCLSVDKKTLNKKTVYVIKRAYRWSKLVFTGIGVGLNFSSFLAAAKEGMTIQNLVFCVIMPAFFVFQVICDIIFEYANYCFRLLKKGVMADVDKIKEKYEKPIEVVKNVKSTFDGIKNVKEGVVGLASSFIKNRKKKKEEKKKNTEEIKEIAASDEEETPEVIEVEAKDVTELPPGQDA